MQVCRTLGWDHGAGAARNYAATSTATNTTRSRRTRREGAAPHGSGYQPFLRSTASTGPALRPLGFSAPVESLVYPQPPVVSSSIRAELPVAVATATAHGAPLPSGGLLFCPSCPADAGQGPPLLGGIGPTPPRDGGEDLGGAPAHGFLRGFPPVMGRAPSYEEGLGFQQQQQLEGRSGKQQHHHHQQQQQ